MHKSLDFEQKSKKPSLWQRLDWRQALAIDLGSNEIRIFRINRVKKQEMEILTIDQACVAIKRSSRGKKAQVLAVGKDALEMRERLGDEVEVIFPIIAGRIINEDMAKVLLKELLKRALKIDRILPFVISPVVVVTVRAGTSELSRRSLSRLFYDLGVSEVHLLAEPLAAAIGVGVPIADASGVLLMQMGASSIEAAALALGSIVSFQSNLWTGTIAGWELDELLRAYLVKEHHLLITLEASEQLKKQIKIDQGDDFSIKLVGKDLLSQKAKTLNIKNEELSSVLMPVLKDYLFLIERLLEEMPNALLSDVLDRGLLLSGNLSKLAGLDHFLAKSLKMPVALVDDPDLAAATGALTVLENLDLFKASLI
jgi:rod shape-determining protein MreB